MPKIKTVWARQILDSRGIPAVESTVVLDDETTASSSAPSGLSKSSQEAVELRDEDKSKYNGMGVAKAVQNVNTVIAQGLAGLDVTAQQAIDKVMIDIDGSTNKSNLGANATLSVSQAVMKAGAKSSSMPIPWYIKQFMTTGHELKMPIPMFNVLEGGKHGRNQLNFQEFLVVPASSKTFSEGLEIGAAVYKSLEKKINDSNMSTLIADEGGFSPDIASNEEALAFLKDAVSASGYTFALDAFLGLDCAANSFKEKDGYRLCDRPEIYDQKEMADLYEHLVSEFSLIYLEDPFAEDDLDGWKKISLTLLGKTLLVGDDLVSTNPFLLQTAINNKVINGIIVKPNQIGTISEAIAVVEIAKFAGYKIIVSHRSGETEDSFIADFAVGVGADYAKLGAPGRERVIKYNRLAAIEQEIKAK